MPPFDFGPADLRACQRLAYAGRIANASDAAGGHRVRRGGEGSEFLDYRAYAPGDDVRRIDWTVFARMRQAYVRVLQQETTLYVHLLVDVSRSMAVGQPQPKAAMACRLACMLGYVALANGDRVSAATFADQLGQAVSELRGRPAIGRLIAMLRAAPIGGTTDLAGSARDFCARAAHRGLVVLISDFLTPSGHLDALRLVLQRRFRLLAIQVLDPVDWGQNLQGTLKLRDSETGQVREVVVTERRRAEYQRLLREHLDRLAQFCTRRGQFHLHASTQQAASHIVVRGLRAQGLLR